MNLDPDVATALKKQMAKQGATMKQVVNEALRAGLSPKATPAHKKYRVRTFSAKLHPDYEWDQMNKILDELEVEDYLNKH